MLAFWYYLTCFNALYQNTQVDLIINTSISFGFSCIYPFLINIIPGIFRIDSLKKINRKLKEKKHINDNVLNNIIFLNFNIYIRNLITLLKL